MFARRKVAQGFRFHGTMILSRQCSFATRKAGGAVSFSAAARLGLEAGPEASGQTYPTMGARTPPSAPMV